MIERTVQPTPEAQRAIDLVEAHETLTRSVARLDDHAQLPGLLNTVLQEIVRASGAVSVAVFAYDRERDELINYAQIVRGEIVDVRDPRLDVFRQPTRATGNPAWDAMIREQYFWVDYINPDPRAGPQSTAWHRANGHGYVVCLPMMNGAAAVGFLGLAFDRSEVVRPTELRLARSRVLAQQAALAMQLTRLGERAQADALAEERERAERAKRAALLEERTRMAREMHDSMAQTFTGVLMQLRAAQSALRGAPELAANCLARAESLAREGLRDARRSVMALRPDAAEYNDLVGKIRWMVEQSTTGTPVAGGLTVDGAPRPVPTDVAFEVFRVAQEAVANALRHANARTLRVNLAFAAREIGLTIADDGVGFEATAEAGQGIGLLSMRHRAAQLNGTLTVESGRGGTVVRLAAPVPT